MEAKKAEAKFKFKVNNGIYETEVECPTGTQILTIAGYDKPGDYDLILMRRGQEELIPLSKTVCLSDPGIERFIVEKTNDDRLVDIKINDKDKKITRGRHSVEEIKNLGNVPLEHELEQLIDGKLTPLEDDGHVIIKGGECFYSHKRDGSSS